MIKILCIGKKHESIYVDAITHFEKRLTPYSKLSWQILLQSTHQGTQARNEESQAILSKIKRSDVVVLFDEKGSNFTSEQLSSIINTSQVNAKDIICVIGGAYGVSQDMIDRADHILAFGTSVFPHQMIRLMITEQLYRAYSINAGSKYHHQ